MRRSSEQLAEMDWWVGLKPGLLGEESSFCLNSLFSVTTNGVCPNGSVGGDDVKDSWWTLLLVVLLCDLLVTCTVVNGSDPNWSSGWLVDCTGSFFLEGVSLTPLVKGTDPNASVCTGGLGLCEFSLEGTLILPFAAEENGCCPNKSTSSDSWWASNGVTYGLAFSSCCLGLKSNISWTWATGCGLWACCTCRWVCCCCCLFTAPLIGLCCSTPTAPCCWMFLRGAWGEAVMGSCSDRDWLGVEALGLSLAMIEVVWTCGIITLWRKTL